MKKSYETAIAAAVDFVTYKDRTEAEVRDKLHEYEFSDSEIDETVAELHEALLLNDTEYAHDFVQTKLAQRPMSTRTLRAKMRKHKLDEDLIDDMLAELPCNTDYENAYAEARNYLLNAMPRTDDRQKLRQKLLRRLIGHGYSYDDAKCAIQNAEAEIDFNQ